MATTCEPMSKQCEWQPTQNYRASVHNTFLRFTEVPDDEDEWMISPHARRVVTDGAVADRSLRESLELSVLQSIQTHLASSVDATGLGEAETPIKMEASSVLPCLSPQKRAEMQEEDAGEGHAVKRASLFSASTTEPGPVRCCRIFDGVKPDSFAASTLDPGTPSSRATETQEEDAGESHEEDGDLQTVKQETDVGEGHEEDGEGQTMKQ
ncbi:unnamed protein product, partial [Polarella glacialis]